MKKEPLRKIEDIEKAMNGKINPYNVEIIGFCNELKYISKGKSEIYLCSLELEDRKTISIQANIFGCVEDTEKFNSASKNKIEVLLLGDIRRKNPVTDVLLLNCKYFGVADEQVGFG